MHTLAAGLIALALSAVPARQIPATGSEPDMTGLWTYNADLSESPAELAPAPGGSARPPAGGPGPRGPGARRYPGGLGSARDGDASDRTGADELARVREAIREAVEPASRLTIVRKEDSLIVTGGDGRSRTIRTDGKKTKEETAYGLKVETSARWEPPFLIVERRFDGGVRVTEQYSVLNEPRQLVIYSTIETDGRKGDQALKTRRVFDAASSPAP